jgi:PadR family transcriptional regulator, regulatory protein PadR
MYIYSMNKGNFCKGCLEPIVLELLRKQGRMYGYEITQKVKDLTRGELTITEGALYPLLHRLEAEGVLTAELEHIGKRVRKYYRLTRVGKKQTNIATLELRTFLQTMQALINPKTI